MTEPAADGFTRPGHPIGVAALRPSFKNGQLANLREAVNVCREDWMATTAFEAGDPRWLGLSDYLIDRAEELAGMDAVPALSFTIVEPPENLTGGDASAGADAFNRSCIVCHGENAVGTERGPAILGAHLSDELIATRIRLSGNPESGVYPGLQNGRMPFWSASRLGDDEVRDIVAFLRTTGATTTTLADGDERVDISLPGAQSDCGSTHPSVGSVGMLSNVAHRVAGTVTIVDDCTLHFDDFTYDGGGIRVEMYSGTDGNFFGGRGLSVGLYGTPFNDAKAELRLPEGVTLADFNSVSVWCVSAGFSFGDVVF